LNVFVDDVIAVRMIGILRSCRPRPCCDVVDGGSAWKTCSIPILFLLYYPITFIFNLILLLIYWLVHPLRSPHLVTTGYQYDLSMMWRSMMQMNPICSFSRVSCRREAPLLCHRVLVAESPPFWARTCSLHTETMLHGVFPFLGQRRRRWRESFCIQLLQTRGEINIWLDKNNAIHQ